MTPAIITPDLAKRQGWARGELGLSAGAAKAEIEAAIWEHLEAANLSPSAAQRQAIRLLCDPQSLGARPKAGCDACLEAREFELIEEVELFFEQFFQLPFNARRLRWTQLLNAADEAFPRIRVRLLSCERGLDIAPDDFEASDPQEKLLAERVGQLFLLKPGERTRQRRRWLTEMQGDWKTTVQRFRRKYAKLATLDVDFLRGLETSQNESRWLQAALARQPKIAPALIAAAKPANTPATPLLRKMTSSIGNASAASNKWPVWLIVVVASMVLRGIASFSSSDSQYNSATSDRPDVLNQQRMSEIMRRLHDSGSPPAWTPDGSIGLPPHHEADATEDVLRNIYRARSTAGSPLPTTGRLPDGRPANLYLDELIHPTEHNLPASDSREPAPSSPRGSAP